MAPASADQEVAAAESTNLALRSQSPPRPQTLLTPFSRPSTRPARCFALASPSSLRLRPSSRSRLPLGASAGSLALSVCLSARTRPLRAVLAHALRSRRSSPHWPIAPFLSHSLTHRSNLVINTPTQLVLKRTCCAFGLMHRRSSASRRRSPTAVVSCVWTARLDTADDGQSPYIITVLPGGQVSAAPLETLSSSATGTQLTWNVDLPVGTSVTLQIRDATGPSPHVLSRSR